MGSHIPPAAHVDVELIDASGRVIAEKQDDIDPIAYSHKAKRLNSRHSYVASFPLEIARKATLIRVTYHLNQHPGDSLGRAPR